MAKLTTKLVLTLFFFFIMVSTGICSQEAPDVFREIPLSVRDRINFTLGQYAKDYNVEKITDIGELYEVIIIQKNSKNSLLEKKGYFFVTKDGKFAILGNVVGDSYTSFGKDRFLEKINVSKLDVSSAVKIVRGSGKRIIYMFIDPDCPFCKNVMNFLKSRPELDNITLYVYFFPLEKIYSESKNKIIKSLCAKDVSKSVEALIYDGIIEKDVQICNKGKERLNVMLNTAKQVGVEGTPTFITEDGYIIRGANISVLSEYLYRGNLSP